MNVLSGFDRPDHGTVELEGRDVTRWSPHRRGRHGLARTFQHSHALPRRCRCARTSRWRRSASAPARARRRGAPTSCSTRLGLARYADAPASSLAHGDERRLGVARALATEPRFVLLDEPAAGLPEAEVPDVRRARPLGRDEHGAGVLLIDHNMALIMETCDRIHVLDQGTTLAEGTPAEIRANLDVAAAYLGEAPVTDE